MTVTTGATVRLLVELLADDGSIVPDGRSGVVIGVVDDRLLVDIEIRETGEHVTVEAEVWEVRRSA